MLLSAERDSRESSDAAHARSPFRQPLSHAIFPRTLVPDEHRPILHSSVELDHSCSTFRAERLNTRRLVFRLPRCLHPSTAS